RLPAKAPLLGCG
nr:Chain C, Enoyl-[acyl-carrier-protein] reductase [NADH] [Mycobacterium tuberculosis H37Rv]